MGNRVSRELPDCRERGEDRDSRGNPAYGDFQDSPENKDWTRSKVIVLLATACSARRGLSHHLTVIDLYVHIYIYKYIYKYIYLFSS